MANKHMKRHSTSLIIREMQVKTTVRYHVKLVRMAIITEIYKQLMLESMGTKGNPPALLLGREIGTATKENSMEVLQKLKIEETYEPSIPLLAQRKKRKLYTQRKL